MELKLVESVDYYEDKEIEKRDREAAMEKRRLTVISQRDKIYDNPKAYAKALELLEENKRRNLSLLRSYGLKV